MVHGSGLKAQGSGLRAQGSALRAQGSGLRGWAREYEGLEFEGLGLGGLGFRAWGLRLVLATNASHPPVYSVRGGRDTYAVQSRPSAAHPDPCVLGFESSHVMTPRCALTSNTAPPNTKRLRVIPLRKGPSTKFGREKPKRPK